MWPKTFDQRLSSWYNLRATAQTLPLPEALELIDQWWTTTPWQPYYLHWDDQANWPDPWQLLSDNVYCYLARGLGILYTISMLNRDDIADAGLVLTDSGHNLVQVAKGKYILNWDSQDVLNNNLATKNIKQYTLSEVKTKYNQTTREQNDADNRS